MQKLLVITGPTNVGKTAFAIELASVLDGEIISADSRQIYKEMDIGTAKPTIHEQNSARHHLIDVINPNEAFTIADFQERAYQAINDIASCHKLPILVGGTGLYIKAVVDGLNIPKVAPSLNLRTQLESLTADQLVEKLAKLDPVSVTSIPSQNKRRLIRAIEVSLTLKKPFSEVSRQFHHQFDTLQIGLTAPRQVLYGRADHGVDRWLKSGWIDEVKTLKKKHSPKLPSMSSIGYQEIGMYLDGELSLEEAVHRVKFARHAYIRRQLTWFRRDGRIHWVDTTSPNWQAEVEKLARSWYSDNSRFGHKD